MFGYKTVLVMLALFCSSAALASLPQSLERGAVPLQQVASEDYRLVWKRITRTGLYVDPGQGTGLGTNLLHPEYNKLLLIEYAISVSAENFVRLTRRPLEKAWPSETLDKHRESIDKLCGLYQDVEAGDRYAIYWLKDKGLTLELNGEPLGVIDDAEAAQIILSIWLGRAAVSEEQRDSLLSAWSVYRQRQASPIPVARSTAP